MMIACDVERQLLIALCFVRSICKTYERVFFDS
eukprot:SAG31_NODE_14575_length_798_cov_1.254649_1_plen_33_part_10